MWHIVIMISLWLYSPMPDLRCPALSNHFLDILHPGRKEINLSMSQESTAVAGGKKVTLVVPGSTSNLGPGLDCIGLALNIYSRMTFQLLEEPEDGDKPYIQLKGGIAKRSDPEHQGNLIYHMLKEIWEHNSKLLGRLRISVTSDIPLGSGLGSSSAAIVGAIWASNVLEDRIPTATQLLAKGCELEGHPETLAASLYGNMVVCAPSVAGRRIVTQRVEWPDDWHVIAVVPDYTLHTADLRAVLPKHVKYEDAVFNAQRTALLVAAVSRHDESAMQEALHDRLHEKYRQKFVPELEDLRRELVNEPILGCVMSGAGASTCIFVHSKNKDKVVRKLNHWAAAQEKSHRILNLQVSKEGMQEVEI